MNNCSVIKLKPAPKNLVFTSFWYKKCQKSESEEETQRQEDSRHQVSKQADCKRDNWSYNGWQSVAFLEKADKAIFWLSLIHKQTVR